MKSLSSQLIAHLESGATTLCWCWRVTRQGEGPQVINPALVLEATAEPDFSGAVPYPNLVNPVGLAWRERLEGNAFPERSYWNTNSPPTWYQNSPPAEILAGRRLHVYDVRSGTLSGGGPSGTPYTGASSIERWANLSGVAVPTFVQLSPVLGFTNHDLPVVFDGTEFEPESGFAASEIRANADMAADAQDAEGVLRSDRITEADIRAGRWDNAEVEVWRVNWQDPSQRVLMRRGNIGRIRRGRAAFVAEVRSLAHFLQQPIGRTFQYFCDAELGDGRCGVDLDSVVYSGIGVVAAPQGDRGFTVSVGLDGFAEGLFSLGVLIWTSGANAGRRAEVALHVIEGGLRRIELAEVPPEPVAAGDGFKISAGCDKRFSTCRDRFGNVANFRGFPTVPGDDLVLRAARPDDPNTGKPLKPAGG